MILLASILVISCGNEADNSSITTEVLPYSDSDLSGIPSDMKITAARINAWKLVDAKAIEQNTIETQTVLYNDKKYEQ